MSSFSTTTLNVNDIYKKLQIIEDSLGEIRDGIRRNDAHITFVTRVYFAMKWPIVKFLGKISDLKVYFEDDEVKDDDVRLIEYP